MGLQVYDVLALQGDLSLCNEFLHLVFAFIFFKVFGCEFQACYGQWLPLLLFEVAFGEADVDHHGSHVAGAREEPHSLAELEHPVKQHAALL